MLKFPMYTNCFHSMETMTCKIDPSVKPVTIHFLAPLKCIYNIQIIAAEFQNSKCTELVIHNWKYKSILYPMILKLSPLFLSVKWELRGREMREPSGITPALMIYNKAFPADCTTREEHGSELFLPRNVILWSRFPGTTQECGNRIHGETLCG